MAEVWCEYLCRSNVYVDLWQWEMEMEWMNDTILSTDFIGTDVKMYIKVMITMYVKKSNEKSVKHEIEQIYVAYIQTSSQ